MTEPTPTEIKVSYSLGRKINFQNYGGASFESMDIHVSETECWNVEGLSDSEVETFRQERYEYLATRLGAIMQDEADELIESIEPVQPRRRSR